MEESHERIMLSEKKEIDMNKTQSLQKKVGKEGDKTMKEFNIKDA